MRRLRDLLRSSVRVRGVPLRLQWAMWLLALCLIGIDLGTNSIFVSSDDDDASPEADVRAFTPPPYRTVTTGPRPLCPRMVGGGPPVTRHDLGPAERGDAPIFARELGHLPADGTPRVGGVELPAGERCGRYWISRDPVPDVMALANRLAAAFPRTGLWPLVWARPDESPQAEVSPDDPAKADRLTAEAVYRREWDAELGGRERKPFPGLAPAQARVRGFAPFGGPAPRADEGPPLLMLVPVHRPADVVATLGLWGTEIYSNVELTAILRSWETRFGAFVQDAGGLTLAVASPPSSAEDVKELDDEMAMLMPDDPGDYEQDRGTWSLGWPD